MSGEMISVPYMVDDVDAAIAFYTTHFGFTVVSAAIPAFADVARPARRDGRCLMAGSRARAAGTASISWSMTWPLRSRGSAPTE